MKKKFRVKDREFILDDVERFYIAVVIKSGYGDETTEISLEWFDNGGSSKVDLVGFGIFVTPKGGENERFLFKSREELDTAVGIIYNQIKA